MQDNHALEADQVGKNNALLDYVMARCGFNSDAAMARALKVAPPVLSKIRHGKLGVGPALLIRIHENADISFPLIRDYVPAS